MGDPSGDFSRREIQAKQNTDQQLAILRHYWGQWNAEDKATFIEWLDRVDVLKRSTPSLCPHVMLRVEFVEPVPEDEHETFSPPIEAMRRAIECWERGEDHGGPGSWEEVTIRSGAR